MEEVLGTSSNLLVELATMSRAEFDFIVFFDHLLEGWIVLEMLRGNVSMIFKTMRVTILSFYYLTGWKFHFGTH